MSNWFVHDGSETSGFGTILYPLTLNNGDPARIWTIQGSISGSPKAGSSPTLAVQRQALIVLSAPGIAPARATAGPLPPIAGANASEVDNSLFAVNLKCMGWNNDRHDLNYTWGGGVLVPAGSLVLTYVLATLWPDGTMNHLDSQIECLDAEAHIKIEWD